MFTPAKIRNFLFPHPTKSVSNPDITSLAVRERYQVRVYKYLSTRLVTSHASRDGFALVFGGRHKTFPRTRQNPVACGERWFDVR